MKISMGTKPVSDVSIETLRQMVDQAADLTEDARLLSERDRDYYDGYQWTAAERAVLQKRRQPVITDNLIKRKIDALVGLEQRGRVDPSALPRNPDDEDAADVATKALMFADDITRFDTIRSAVTYNLGIEGYGGVEVCVKERGSVLDPDITRMRFEEIFFDPHSREADFSDAAYMGVQKWLALDAAVAHAKKYAPDMEDVALSEMLEMSMHAPSGGETYEDRPRQGGSQWGDAKKKRVRLVQMYHRRDGGWHLALFSGGGIISNEPSPYLDEFGRPDNAMILQSCYVDRENRRYGLVRDMVPLQDETNKRRSRLLAMLSQRQTMGQRGAVADVAKMKRELASVDGHVEYDQDPSTAVPSFQLVPVADQIAGQFALLEYTTNGLNNLGPNASLIGQLEGQQSGRAIIAQQQAGYAELAPFYDGVNDFTIRVYRALWNRIRQYWTEPRWIRVTDETQKLRFVGINQPAVDEFGNPAVGQDGQPVVENSIAELDVDIVVNSMPEIATLQAEQFEQITQLVSSGMIQLPPEVIIRASSLRNKGEILEALKGPEQDPMQQAQQQLQMRAAEAQVADTEASVALKQAQAMKAQAEAQAAGMPDQMGEAQPADPKPYIDAELKRAALDEQARQHNDKMALQRAEMAMRAPLDQAMTAADVNVKAAQAAKLRRPEPGPNRSL